MAKAGNKFQDNSIIGKRFNKLVIISFAPPKQHPTSKAFFSRVICKCDCGDTKEISLFNVKNGNTKSCGCLSLTCDRGSTTHLGYHGAAINALANVLKEFIENTVLPEGYVYKISKK